MTSEALDFNTFKILAIGDPHFKTTNNEETDILSNKVVELIITHKPDAVVVLGDILDRFENIHVNPLKRSIDFLHRIKSISPFLYIIIGNHDRPNNNVFLTDEHPFTALKLWDRTLIIDDLEIVQNPNQPRMLFIPYVYPGRLDEALATKNLAHPLPFDIVFAHQEFYGCTMSAITSSVGDKWPLDAPLCISGHIHDYQELQSNCIYTGTPLQHGYSDSSRKTISFFTFGKKEEWTLISHQRIELGLPIKKILRLTPEELTKFVPEPNTILKIVVEGDPAVIREVMKLDSVKGLTQTPNIKIVINNTNINPKNALPNPENIVSRVSFQRRLIQALSVEKKEIQQLFKETFNIQIE